MTTTYPAPGPDLARVLSQVDPILLDRSGRVAYAAAWERQVRWTQAQALTAVAYAAGEKPRRDDFVIDEVAAELALSPGQAQSRVALARDLGGPRRATLEALAHGDIGLDQAKILSTELGKLPDEQAADIEKLLLDNASGQTKKELESAARKAVTAANPDLARERRATASEHRAAWIRPLGDGLTMIGLLHTDETAAHVWAKVEALADNGTGTKDQNRADALAKLVLGADAPKTQLVVHAERHDLGPVLGELLDTPIDPESLTKLLAGSMIRWHDPAHPPPETRAYRPSRTLDRWVRQQDRRCQGLGCPVDAANSDVHHVEPYAKGGPTAAHNLMTLCRHCHRLVHEGGWTVHLDATRTVTWTSPAGKRYGVSGLRPRTFGGSASNHSSAATS